MELRSSDLQSDGDLDSIRNSCDVLKISFSCVQRTMNFVLVRTEDALRKPMTYDD